MLSERSLGTLGHHGCRRLSLSCQFLSSIQFVPRALPAVECHGQPEQELQRQVPREVHDEVATRPAHGGSSEMWRFSLEISPNFK